MGKGPGRWDGMGGRGGDLRNIGGDKELRTLGKGGRFEC